MTAASKMSHICCFSVPSETAWPFSWLFLSSEQGWHSLRGWSWGLLSLLLQVTVLCSTRAPAPLGSPALLLQRRLMEKGQAQQLAAKNFLCFQPPPSFFFFFSFPLTISHSLFYIKPCSVLVRSLSCFGFSAPLNFSVLLSRGWGCRLPRLFHCFPVSRGVGEGMWNKETDAFSPLLAKDALNLWSFPQRGLLYIVSLGPGPHRLKPI